MRLCNGTSMGRPGGEVERRLRREQEACACVRWGTGRNVADR